MRAALLLVLASFTAAAQVPAPQGWHQESFAFPLQVAPAIPYEGTEHLRFSPDWSSFASERGFSYVFLWDIRRRPLDPQELERSLKLYFDGVMGAAAKGRKLAEQGAATQVSIHPMAAPKGWGEAFAGRISTWNAFSRGEPLGLHFEVALRPCGADRTHAFFALSRAPRQHPVWSELRAVREATPCG